MFSHISPKTVSLGTPRDNDRIKTISGGIMESVLQTRTIKTTVCGTVWGSIRSNWLFSRENRRPVYSGKPNRKPDAFMEIKCFHTVTF